MSVVSDMWNGVKGFWQRVTGNDAISRQNRMNVYLQEHQAEMNEAFYNKYSSPQALMRQYQEAGLNPNLVYGTAAAGQGNVPEYHTPNINREMSGAEKLNVALSTLSQLMGLRIQTYQVDAAREAAEQAGLKTLNDAINYRRNSRDYNAENAISGYQEETLWKRLFKKRRGNITQAEIEGLFPEGYVSDPKYVQYLSAARQKYFEDMRRSGVQNRVDTANAVGREIENKYLDDYYQTRNDQMRLDYEIDSEFKKATEFSNIGAQWLQPILKLLTSLVSGRRK